jgi:gas vesicle protein
MGDNTTSGLMVGLAVGLVAGVALGLLLAPKEGEEARRMVRDAIESGIERVRQRGDGAADQG